MRSLFCLLAIFISLFESSGIAHATTLDFNPNFLLSDEAMTDTSAMTKEEIQHLLQRGTLATYTSENILGLKKSAADIIYETALEFQLNPQFLLVLLQREQSLVENKQPSLSNYDWAMGYAICDDCSKNDPLLQSYKGFGKQVYFGAKRIRETYLTEMENKGKTFTGIGPGIATTIDGMQVLPENMATAALYTYTPHLHGNKNFVAIWNRWFQNQFLDGTLVQNEKTGAVWLIHNQSKRLITSKAVLYSRFNPKSLIRVSEKELASYESADPIRVPNYSLLRSTKGTVYLIVDDTKRGFVSHQAFIRSGFLDDEIVDATDEELHDFVDSDPITEKTTYVQKALLQDTKTGGVFAVENNEKHPIFSKEILLSHVQSPELKRVSTKELDKFQTSDPLLFPDGTLMGAKGSPDVFVVEHGKRRPIADEATFDAYGWKWHQVVWTNERSVLLHPLGLPVSNVLDSDVSLSTASN